MNEWKFYRKANGGGFGGSLVLIICNTRTRYDDYFSYNGNGHYGWNKNNISLSNYTNGILKEIPFDEAIKYFRGPSAIAIMVRWTGMDLNSFNPPFQGPPDPNRIKAIKITLKRKRAFCADSALEQSFDGDGLITLNYLLYRKEVFKNKNDFNKYYIPEEA